MGIFESLYNQTVDNIYSVSKNMYGDVSKTSVYTNVPCRFQRVKKKIFTTENVEVPVDAEIWLSDAYSDVTEDYIFEVDSVEYKIVNIDYQYDILGELDHIKFFLV